MKRSSLAERRILTLGALLALGLATAWLWGCGTDGYETTVRTVWDDYPRSLTGTGNALIDNGTLRSWIDNGLVNAEADERVVVVEVGDCTVTYENLHLPGALFLNQALLVAPRAEGVDPRPTGNELPPGAQMDNLVQSLGIDERSTVVFTVPRGKNLNYAARAYFSFRYWGFPKDRLKVLNGGNAVYAAPMDGLLGTKVPTPVVPRSSFSVRLNRTLRDDLRASLGEMIRAVSDNGANLAVIDARGGTSGYRQVTGEPGITTVTGSFKALLEGRVRDAAWIPPNDIASTPEGAIPGFAGADNVIRTGAALDNLLAMHGIDSTKTAYAYCQTGVQGAVPFLVLDGVLGWKAVLYDGSSSQWGILSDRPSHGGCLPPGSPWAVDDLTVHGRFDNVLPGSLYPYPDNAAVTVYSFTPQNPWLPLDDPRMNQVEEEDKAYMAAPDASSGGGSGGGSSGGGC